MASFNKTEGLLNGLIAKLEANTGGENLHQEQSVACKPSSHPGPKIEETTEAQENTQKKEKQKKVKKTVEKVEKIVQKTDQLKKDEKQVEAQLFAQIDMRIGEIVQCWKHPDSEKLYCEKINVCGEVREIASGLQQFVPMDEMKGLVVVMANLKPRPLAKFMSNGMVVCASNADHSSIKILRPQGQISERIYLQGYQQLFKSQALLPVLNPKKKILEKCLQHFRTDEQGYVIWKGIKVRTAAGYLHCDIQQGNVS